MDYRSLFCFCLMLNLFINARRSLVQLSDLSCLLDTGDDTICLHQIIERASNSTDTSDDTDLVRTKRMDHLPSDNEEEYDQSLSRMLVNIALREMNECPIAIVYEGHFDDSLTVHALLSLPNIKQVVRFKRLEDLNKILWRSTTHCSGYFFLLEDVETLINFSNNETLAWDYSGRYVIVTPSLLAFEDVTKTSKVMYTEHVIGMTMSKYRGQWNIFMNKFYWEGGSLRVASGRKNLPSRALFPDRVRSFNGSLLKIVTFEWAPNIFYELNKDGSLKSLYGMDIEMIRALAKLLNFEIQFVEPPKGEYWGSSQADGSWTGLVGKLKRREGDVGVANMFISSIRKVVIDYTAPYNSDTACFLLAKPAPLPQWQSLLFPFQMEMWVAYLSSIFICGIVLAGVLGNFKEIVAYILISFQGHVREVTTFSHSRISIRIFLGFLWLYTSILTSIYSSNLTAFLTITRQPKAIDTIKELYYSGKTVGAASYFFKGTLAASEDEMVQSFAEDFQVYQEEEELFAEVKKSSLVYLQNRLYLEYKMATRDDAQAGYRGYRIMKECLNPFSIALGMPKNSPLKRRFDVVLQWLVESGLVRKWFVDSLEIQAKRLHRVKSSQSNKTSVDSGIANQTGTTSLGILHLQGVFLIFIIGNLLALGIFLLELCLAHHFRAFSSTEISSKVFRKKI